MPVRPNTRTIETMQPDQTRLRRQVKWLLLLRVTLLSLLLGVSSLLQYTHPGLLMPSYLTIFTFILAVYFFSIVSAALINQLSHFRLFTFAQIFADSIFTTVIIYYSGGSHSVFSFIYLFPVISGGLTLCRRDALLLSFFSICNYGLVLSSESIYLASRLPPQLLMNDVTNPTILLQNFLVYGLSFILVALLSSLLAERLYRTEQALSRTSREYDILSLLYKQIFDDISSGIITVDSQGVITSFNPASEDITGYHAWEVVGRKLDSIFPEFHRGENAIERPLVDITHKSSSKLPVGYSWAKLNIPNDCDDCRVYTLQDLRKIKEMEEQVQQSEKMAAIGEIAAGIAHEFRNPLAAISGAAQVLQQDTATSEDNLRLLNIIVRESARLEENIVDFLQFSKPSQPEPSWLSLKDLVEECWDLIQHGARFQSHCRIEIRIPENFDCWADHHQLKQVLINLLHNACVAMRPDGGSVTVTAEDITTDSGAAMASVQVSDTGCGIEPGILAAIFDPFFTSRENGTGLGLAIVKQIIEGHNGTIRVSSTPQQGATFTFTLPAP